MATLCHDGTAAISSLTTLTAATGVDAAAVGVRTVSDGAFTASVDTAALGVRTLAEAAAISSLAATLASAAGLDTAALGVGPRRDHRGLVLDTAAAGTAVRAAGDGLMTTGDGLLRTAGGSTGDRADDSAGVLPAVGDLADHRAAVNAAALRDSAAGDLEAARVAGDLTGGPTGVDAAAVRRGAAGDLAGMAAGVDATADRVAATGEEGEAGVAEVGNAKDTDRRGRDVAAGAAAAGMDAATGRGAAGGRRASLTEVLGERTLHELGKWIHDFIPYQEVGYRGL
jgi:hypothetical protein